MKKMRKRISASKTKERKLAEVKKTIRKMEYAQTMSQFKIEALRSKQFHYETGVNPNEAFDYRGRLFCVFFDEDGGTEIERYHGLSKTKRRRAAPYLVEFLQGTTRSPYKMLRNKKK